MSFWLVAGILTAIGVVASIIQGIQQHAPKLSVKLTVNLLTQVVILVVAGSFSVVLLGFTPQVIDMAQTMDAGGAWGHSLVSFGPTAYILVVFMFFWYVAFYQRWRILKLTPEEEKLNKDYWSNILTRLHLKKAKV